MYVANIEIKLVARAIYIECKIVIIEHMYVTGNKFNILYKQLKWNSATIGPIYVN